MPRKVEISHRTIVFTVFFLIFLWLVFLIRDILLQFFIGLLIMAILNPLVTRFSRYKIPRSLSVILVYVLLIAVLSFSVGAIVPPLVEQTTAFVTNIPEFINRLGISSLVSDQVLQQFSSQLAIVPTQIAKATVSLFSNLLGLVAILVLAFYLLSEREKLDEQLGVFLGDKRKKDVTRVIDSVEKKLGDWARGQLTLMFVVGFTSYVGLRLLEIPFALPLSIIAGLFEIVPYLGPIIAAIPAVLIGLGISPITGLAVTALAFLVQQLENYVFIPKIMQKSTGINPIITLFSLTVGFKLAGVVGILISVPIFVTFQIVLKEYLSSKEA